MKEHKDEILEFVSADNEANNLTNDENAEAQKQKEAPYELKQSMYIKDIEMHKPKYYYDNAFCIDSCLTTYKAQHNYSLSTALKSMQKYHLPINRYNFWRAENGTISEWGYSFFLTTTNGMGDVGAGGFNPIPTTREEAITQLQNWLITKYKLTKEEQKNGFFANNGHYPWNHYAAEIGANEISAELGECISSTQSRIAFARGAARQYNVSWVCDFSYWYRGYNRGYADDMNHVFNGASYNYGPDKGHSHSLHERVFILGYLGGAGYFLCEDAIGQYFWRDKLDKDGCYELTDAGKLVQKYYDFTKREKDIGIQYVPFGILMDREHGSWPGDVRVGKEKVFQVFNYTPADHMNMDIMQMFFPGTNGNTDADANETKFLVNSPYGESCDVILQNASQKALDSYPCLIMSGDLSDATSDEVSRYTKYVKQGGILVMNTAYLDLFPEYKAKYDNSGKMEIQDEKGRVIIYGNDYDISKLGSIVSDLIKELMPFEIEGGVDYMINIKNGSMLVTVMNNKGVYKPAEREGWVDESATTDVKVTYKGDMQIKSVREIYEQEAVSLQDKSVTTTLTPGAIRIIEFYFG